MKIGVRKPNYKSRIKARTTGRIKREVRSSVNPLYGKKGMGYIKDPERAVKNKIYHTTTVRVPDGIPSAGTGSRKTDSRTTPVSDQQEKPSKAGRTWGIILLILGFLFIGALPYLSFFEIIVGIVLLVNYHKSMKQVVADTDWTPAPTLEEKKTAASPTTWKIVGETNSCDDDIAAIPMYPICLGVAGSLKRRSLSDMPEYKNRYKLLKGDRREFVALDVETSGLEPQICRICQLSAIKYQEQDGKLQPVEKFDSYINPHVKITEQASSVNGLTNEMLADKPTISQVYDSFMEFVGKDPIIGYNVAFDLKFLWCSGFDLVTDRRVYDIYGLARRTPIDTENYKLETVASYYRLCGNNHNSLVDCYLTEKVMEHLLEEQA